MLRRFASLTLLFLAACTDGADDYPRLLPTQQILAEPTLPDHAGTLEGDALQDQIEAQGAATRARADAIPDPVDDAALAARAADLRRRAEALRHDSTAECPTGATAEDCPDPES